MKKIISFMLAIVMIVSMSAISVSASAVDAETSGIVNALNSVECVKDQLGLASVDFEQLSYSTNHIYAYDYRDRRKFCVIDVPRQYENLRLSQE